MNDVAAIILAAGCGIRFDVGPKLLTSLKGQPLLRYVVQAATVSIADPVIVVTGHRSGEVETALAGLDARFVLNPSYENGLSTSLKAGFRALPNHTKAAVVLLGDMPLIRPDLIDTLVNAWREKGEPAALIPTMDGRRGNPVILSRSLEPEIMRLTGDTGAGPILRGRSDVVEYAVVERAVFQDVDTVEDFKDLSTEA
ncbi:NTP transferase domain-containing protein [Microvirga sp. 2YAF29]|uniref:nucleotidyltransferase family protein n=1 Tax=Microvirga sp. 2YAF29 TaxID=3233031 RepID=UPI003F964366